MKTLNLVMEDIKSLRGADVTIFGQPTTLSKDVNRFTIDTLNVLDTLKDYEIDIDEIEVPQNYSKADNTYNWCAPISNDINFEIYNTDVCYICVRVHRFGDVRCNYTDDVWFCFDSDYDFYEIITENTNIYNCVEIDGKEYTVDVSLFSEGYEVYSENGDYVCTAYGYDETDIVESIKENIK